MEISLTNHELQIVYNTILRLEEAGKQGVNGLKDCFAENPRLIITPSNNCSEGCLHCVANSTCNGRMMDYEKFSEVDKRFFQIFDVADFGRKGNPLGYDSEGRDLADVIGFLKTNGLGKCTIAAPIRHGNPEVIDRLEELSDMDLETMVTYHHYFDSLNTEQLARDLNRALKDYLRFSSRIVISLLGDAYPQDRTMAEEVESRFEANRPIILKGVDEDKIKIPRIDTRVHPFGRFREYLATRGILDEYIEWFEERMRDYVCPDLIKWPGIVIEPDGGLNFCGSFEAIGCRKAVVSNVFKPYEQMESDLLRFHKQEREWFADNLERIVAGKVSTCKLQNRCYQQLVTIP
jgi:hypothetical protein